MKKNRGACRKAAAEALREFSAGPGRRHLERFAYGLCGDAEEACELAQETCYRALKAGVGRVRGSVSSWLRTAIRNAFYDATKRSCRRSVSFDATVPDSDLTYVDVLDDGSAPLGEAMEREETRAEVRLALDSMPGSYREVLELCDMAGMSYEDAARRLGIQVGTLRSRLFRARAVLRRLLKWC